MTGMAVPLLQSRPEPGCVTAVSHGPRQQWQPFPVGPEGQYTRAQAEALSPPCLERGTVGCLGGLSGPGTLEAVAVGCCL